MDKHKKSLRYCSNGFFCTSKNNYFHQIRCIHPCEFGKYCINYCKSHRVYFTHEIPPVSSHISQEDLDRIFYMKYDVHVRGEQHEEWKYNCEIYDDVKRRNEKCLKLVNLNDGVLIKVFSYFACFKKIDELRLVCKRFQNVYEKLKLKNFNHVNDDVLIEVFLYLTKNEIYNKVALVCKRFQNVIYFDLRIWKNEFGYMFFPENRKNEDEIREISEEEKEINIGINNIGDNNNDIERMKEIGKKFVMIPDELFIYEIFCYLSLKTVCKVFQSCKRFNNYDIFREIWKDLFLKRYGETMYRHENIDSKINNVKDAINLCVNDKNYFKKLYFLFSYCVRYKLEKEEEDVEYLLRTKKHNHHRGAYLSTHITGKEFNLGMCSSDLLVQSNLLCDFGEFVIPMNDDIFVVMGLRMFDEKYPNFSNYISENSRKNCSDSYKAYGYKGGCIMGIYKVEKFIFKNLNMKEIMSPLIKFSKNAFINLIRLAPTRSEKQLIVYCRTSTTITRTKNDIQCSWILILDIFNSKILRVLKFWPSITYRSKDILGVMLNNNLIFNMMKDIYGTTHQGYEVFSYNPLSRSFDIIKNKTEKKDREWYKLETSGSHIFTLYDGRIVLDEVSLIYDFYFDPSNYKKYYLSGRKDIDEKVMLFDQLKKFNEIILYEYQGNRYYVHNFKKKRKNFRYRTYF